MKTTRALIILTVFSASAFASFGITQAQTPSSGMLLGVYALENWRGLRITDTIPGYSAHGRLFPNDVLIQVADGNTDRQGFDRLRSTCVAIQCGPTQANG